MGCRTRANEYYMELSRRQVQLNSGADSLVEGNVVRKVYVNPSPEPERIERHEKKRGSAYAYRAFRRQKIRFILLGTSASLLVVGLCVLMLFALDKNRTLTADVSARESKVEELTVYNDAREYEINSSVDLNYVIDVATNELGMVRSSASQIVTYSVKNSEYLQQVAQVPVTRP